MLLQKTAVPLHPSKKGRFFDRFEVFELKTMLYMFKNEVLTKNALRE